MTVTSGGARVPESMGMAMPFEFSRGLDAAGAKAHYGRSFREV